MGILLLRSSSVPYRNRESLCMFKTSGVKEIESWWGEGAWQTLKWPTLWREAASFVPSIHKDIWDASLVDWLCSLSLTNLQVYSALLHPKKLLSYMYIYIFVALRVSFTPSHGMFIRTQHETLVTESLIHKKVTHLINRTVIKNSDLTYIVPDRKPKLSRTLQSVSFSHGLVQIQYKRQVVEHFFVFLSCWLNISLTTSATTNFFKMSQCSP